MLLVCRYPSPAPESFVARAHRAVELLSAQPGCRRAVLGRGVDDDTWLLVVEFDSVNAYRHAMSPFEVREHVVPLLSAARAEQSTFELLASATDGEVTEYASLVAADAGQVSLGEAAGPTPSRFNRA